MKKLSLVIVLVAAFVVAARGATTQLNVLSFGADPTGVRSSDAAFNACAAAARGKFGMYIPGATGAGENGGAIYKVKSVDISGIPQIYSDAGGLYSSGASIIQEVGATNDLFWFSDPIWRPEISNITLYGQKERNLRNARTITAVASRYQFTVSSAPPDASYNREVFFFLPPTSNSDSYHYLGSGMVETIAGTTITVSALQDWFATPTAGAGKLTPGVVACFGERVTEEGVTISDPTRAGYCAINLTGIGGYLILNNVRFEDWHCDLRIGLAGSVDARATFHRAMNFAAIYCAFPAGGDHRYGWISGGGNYSPQRGATDTTIPLTDPLNRHTKFGAWFSGGTSTVDDFQMYSFQRNLQTYFMIPLTIRVVDAGSSIYENIVIDNLSRVSIGSLWAYNVGRKSSGTYPVILNVNGNLSVGALDCFSMSAPNDSQASSVLESATTNAITSFGTLQRTTGANRLEVAPNSLSQITTYSLSNMVVSAKGLEGRFLVFRDPNTTNDLAQYGIRMNGVGSTNNPFRTTLFSYDPDSAGINIQTDGKIGLGRIATQYAVEAFGDVAMQGRVIPYWVFLPPLLGSSIPATNQSGASWFFTTNSSGVQTMAARYPSSGEIVYFIDNDRNLTVNNLVATNFTAAVVTATTSINAPLLSLAALTTSTLYATNGVTMPVGSKISLDATGDSYLQQGVGGSVKLNSTSAGGGNGNIVLAVNGVTQLESGGNVSAQFDGNAGAGNTRFLLWDVTAGSLKRVSVGAADSGGVGYKLLRVAN